MIELNDIRLEVRRFSSSQRRKDFIAEFVGKNAGKTMIIYCNALSDTDELNVVLKDAENVVISAGETNIKTDFVIHYNMPCSIEKYCEDIQNCSEAILLYMPSDANSLKYMIEKGYHSVLSGKSKREAVCALNTMIDYCSTMECLKVFILRHFGEKKAQNCNSCSSCDKHLKRIKKRHK